MGSLDNIYSKLPVGLQNSVVTLYGWYWHWLRFGGDYPTYERGYRKRDRWTAEQWHGYQSAQLRDLLSSAAKSVPYYRRTWNAHQKQAAQEGNLPELPLLDKEPIRQAPLDFCGPSSFSHRPLLFHTSGSTGTPIATYWTVNELRDSLAEREVRSANWAGVSYKQARATFSGRLVEPNPDSKGPYHRYNAAENQVYFSAFHLRAETANQYVKALWDYKVQWMIGYAVSYYLLAKFIVAKKLKVPPLKAIITTSEKLTPEMRDLMQQVYSCRVYEEYSTVENALFASECEYGRLHVNPDVSIVEILRRDGTPCEPNEPGEVVTTCLMRRLQPFIRYRLGDIAAWDSSPCPCGREMPVIKEVIGRVEDVIIGPDGRQMVRFHGIFTNQPNIIEGQIIQETKTGIRVKVVPTEYFTQSDSEEIVHRIRQRLGNEVTVSVETVLSIPRSRSGKFKAVISLIKSDVDSNHNPGMFHGEN